ncbi:extracellular solute-binding protein [Anaerocolumna jejuensis]|uniref:extracellular solute-binding protein n=1 Tax=Anaerocolumna jejuensis TaxID=259063 RepID=UPI003F7B7AFC
MKIKKVISIVLVFAVILTMTAGCGKTNKKKEEKAVAMGRYVEKTIEMPEKVAANEEYAWEMLKNPVGKIELYASSWKSKNGKKVIQYTLRDDNKWIRTIPKWLNVLKNVDVSISYAPDGTKYASMCKNKNRKSSVHFFKSTDNENGEEFTLEGYDKSVDYSKAPMNIEVLKDNSILLTFYSSCSLYKDGKESSSFTMGDYNYALSGNKLLAMNEKMDGGLVVDVTTGKTVSEIPMEKTHGAFTADKKGNWYMVSSSGIHRMVKDGSSWETVLDGALATMSMPTQGPESIIVGDKDDFYVMYQSGNGIRIIKRYVYDKSVPTTPSKTLSIVSLDENMTVKNAIADFQHKNQDVMVEYRALMSGADGTTKADQIKTINTELLAGKGADILILDGMPVDSYIEKGVLSDLSGIIEPLVKSGKLIPNIMNNYIKDGKIYTAPLRCSLTFAYGSKDAVGATTSLQALANYAKTAKTPLLGKKMVSYSDITKIFFEFYSNEFYKDKTFKREELIKFLEQLKIISDQTKATKEEVGNPMYDTQQMFLNEISAQLVNDHEALLGLSNISFNYGIFAPIGVLDKTKGVYATINNEFVPSSLISINKASTQKDLAGDFIKTLFEEKAQKAEIGDGFPVNAKALSNFALAYDDFYGEFGSIIVQQPSKEKMQKFLELCKQVTTPVNTDNVLVDMISKETSAYLDGSTDANTTADQIIKKTKAYLEE